jgi:hypothetical protein
MLGVLVSFLMLVFWVLGSSSGDDAVRNASPAASSEQPAGDSARQEPSGPDVDRPDVEEPPAEDDASSREAATLPGSSGQERPRDATPPASSATPRVDGSESETDAATVAAGAAPPVESPPVATGQVVGRITDGGTTAAEGLADIEVRLYDGAGALLLTAVTASEPASEIGTFAFEDVPAGEYSIIATRATGTPRSIVRTFDAFPPGADRILSVDMDFADPGARVPTRTLTLPEGTIRLAGPVDADRTVVVEVVDVDGTNVGPAGGIAVPVDAGGVNAQVDLANIRVGPGLRLRAVGEGTPFRGYETVTSEPFDLPPDLAPFVLPLAGPDNDAPRLEVLATSQVTGAIFGFSASPLELSPLSGATITFPAQSRPDASDGSAFTVTTASDGAFTATVRAGTYLQGATSDRDTASFGGISVSASGYETRSLSGSIADSMDTLSGVSSFVLLYPGLTGEPGDVGLDPTPRDVTVGIDLTAIGDATVSRSVNVRLLNGTIAGQPTRLPDGTVQRTFVAVPTADAPLGVLTAGTEGAFTFTGVPIGTYTLEVTGDHVRTLTVPGVSVAPGTGAFTLAGRSVTARTELTLTVTGLQEVDSELKVTPLAGVTVQLGTSLAASGERDGTSPLASATTDAEGKLTVWVDAGDHAVGAVTIEKTGYLEFESPLETFDDVTAARPYELQPAPQDVSGTISMTGSAGLERDVTVELWPSDSDFSVLATRVESVTITVAAGTDKTFSLSEVPVARYRIRVTGSDVSTTTADRNVGPQGGTIDLGRFTIDAIEEEPL